MFNWFKKKHVLAKREGGEYVRFPVHEGNQIYLYWCGAKFPLELCPDGSTICRAKGIKGSNKPYYWTWIEDDGREAENSTF